MNHKTCKLFDQNIVHDIIVSAGFIIAEYLRKKPSANADEICSYIEVNAEAIIDDTVWHLKKIGNIIK